MNGYYKHYKGNLYKVISVATHTETGEQFVVYMDTYGAWWVRPKTMFEEMVEVDGKLVKRFEFLYE